MRDEIFSVVKFGENLLVYCVLVMMRLGVSQPWMRDEIFSVVKFGENLLVLVLDFRQTLCMYLCLWL